MPGELVMKLIATERKESQSHLSFWIESVSSDGDYESPEFNIHNIVTIRFLVTKISYNHYKVQIAIRKAILVNKDLAVNLYLHPYYRADIRDADELRRSCTEEWSQWIDLSSTPHLPGHYQLWVQITVSKVESIKMKLYEDEEFTDFQLSTAEGSVAVHKAHLAANSEVFKTMLQREWKETTEGRINMEGVTLQTLHQLKDYMYLGTLPDGGLYPLLHLSMCYMMDNLKAECLMKLAQTVTAENLYDILAYSFINNLPELTFEVLRAMPKSIVDDARRIMIESQKSCKKAEADKTDEPEQSNK